MIDSDSLPSDRAYRHTVILLTNDILKDVPTPNNDMLVQSPRMSLLATMVSQLRHAVSAFTHHDENTEIQLKKPFP